MSFFRSTSLLLLVLTAILLIHSRGFAKAQETQAKAADTPEYSATLITVEQLQLAIKTGAGVTRLLDCRPKAEYDAGHILNAQWVDVNDWRELAHKPGGLTDVGQWQSRIEKLGIEHDYSVVVYGANPSDTARVWWTLKYLSVPDTRMLDGGWKAWLDGNGNSFTDVPNIPTSHFEPIFDSSRLATKKDLLECVKENHKVILDARSMEEFSGKGGPAKRKGRVPGALHLEWKDLLAEDGRFKSPEELRATFKARGLTPDKAVITHCQSGGRSSVECIALELAGFKNVQNYYGGWAEWSSDESAPITADK